MVLRVKQCNKSNNNNHHHHHQNEESAGDVSLPAIQLQSGVDTLAIQCSREVVKAEEARTWHDAAVVDDEAEYNNNNIRKNEQKMRKRPKTVVQIPCTRYKYKKKTKKHAN